MFKKIIQLPILSNLTGKIDKDLLGLNSGMNTSNNRLLENKVVCISSVKSEISLWHKTRSESSLLFLWLPITKLNVLSSWPALHLPESMKSPSTHDDPLKNKPKVTVQSLRVILQTTYLLWCKRENSVLHRLRGRLIEFLFRLTFSTLSVDWG